MKCYIYSMKQFARHYIHNMHGIINIHNAYAFVWVCCQSISSAFEMCIKTGIQKSMEIK